MSKELFVTSTPHETKVAIVEDDQLVEIYYERENEYTLAGSIYKGRVTRVLPGMQSAFVDIGLERDAFLYVSDFMELEGEDDDLETIQAKPGAEPRTDSQGGIQAGAQGGNQSGNQGGNQGRGGQAGNQGQGRNQGRQRGRGRRGRGGARDRAFEPREAQRPAELAGEAPQQFDNDIHVEAELPMAPGGEISAENTGAAEELGPRRWRGRRGRRRRGGRGREEEQSSSPQMMEGATEAETLPDGEDVSLAESETEEPESSIAFEEHEQTLQPEAALEPSPESAQMERPAQEPRRERFDNRWNRGRGGQRHEGRGGERGRQEGGRERGGFAGESGGFRDENRPVSGSTNAPVILPGESLAKFNRKPEEGNAGGASGNAPGGATSQTGSSFKPSTLVNDVSGFAASGLLAGETLRKYRGREGEAKSDVREARAEQRIEEQQKQPEEHASGEHATEVVDAAPEAVSTQAPTQERQRFEQQQRPGRRDRHGRGRQGWRQREEVPQEKPAEERHEATHAPDGNQATAEAPAGFDRADTEAEQPRSMGAHDYGTGAIEEELVEGEEDSELQQLTESHAGGEDEFDDLEEETLTDEMESDEMRASEQLAAAVVESRRPGAPAAFLEEEKREIEGDDITEEVMGEDDAEFEGAEEEGTEVLAEADFSGGEDEELDPEDPNYEGRAELRAPAGTAAFQRAPREGRPDPRRGRGGRGGPRRPMHPRGGGSRRNIQREPLPQINELLKEGQEILVQIAKEPMAKKGARITSHIALPGRFLVYMPSVNHTGVSRKIGSDEERLRLKHILLSEKGTAHGGFIVRTAAAGASEEDLRADIRFLINLWNEIKQRSEGGKAPALIYHDLNLVERILRDQVTANFSQIWVDGEQEYERILRFAQRFQPALLKRVKLWTKDTPLYENFGLQDEINKALKSKVWLKSGGYIVINQTEALVAIDINTGKYVGKTSRLEDTIVKTNMDAIKEIVRQIRLRDLGGIIVIDFIDMDERRNRHKVMAELEEALKSDRSPSKVLQFNDFGLVAITRKRVKQSLERTLGTTCTYCTGTGFIKSVSTTCNEIYTEMRKIHKQLDGRDITLRVNPEVAKALKAASGRWLIEMEEMTGKSMIVKSDPTLHQEQFDIH